MGKFNDFFEEALPKQETTTSNNASPPGDDIIIDDSPNSISFIDDPIESDTGPIYEVQEQQEKDEPRVPESILNKENEAGIELKRVRYDGHSKLNNLIKEDWIKAIELDPDSFDAILHRATIKPQPATETDGYEKPLFSTINAHQSELDYEDPVLVSVLDCPTEMEAFAVLDSGDDSTGVPDSVLILRIGARSVPIGSILQWDEALSNGDIRHCWWYIHQIFTYGTTSVGNLFYCIPCRSYEGVLHNDKA